MSPEDARSRGAETADFDRMYDKGIVATLIAPEMQEERQFVRWLVDGAVNGNRTIPVFLTLSGGLVMEKISLGEP